MLKYCCYDIMEVFINCSRMIKIFTQHEQLLLTYDIFRSQVANYLLKNVHMLRLIKHLLTYAT
jgi:hypothetical protein